VVQRDWDRPKLAEWLDTLHRHIASCASPPILVAHWVEMFGQGASAALLVCPSDVDSAAHTPPEVRGFSPMPLMGFPCRSIVVASTNDPRVDLPRAEFFAASWGSRFVTVKDAGHMNEQSGIGDWAAGRRLLLELLRAATE
jgi:predicted alpha/beta hydrolase family esterase